MKKLKRNLFAIFVTTFPLLSLAVTIDVTSTHVYIHPSPEVITSSPSTGYNGLMFNGSAKPDSFGQDLAVWTSAFDLAKAPRNGGSNRVTLDSILQNNQMSNPYMFTPAQIRAMDNFAHEVYICLFGYNYTWIPQTCVHRPRTASPPTSCAVTGANRIDFGTIAAGQASDNGDIWMVSCTNPTTVTVTVSNMAANSSTVELDAAKGVSADMTIGNGDGLTGITFTTGAGTAHPFVIMAHLVTQPTTPGGAYSGNAIIVATWA